MRTIWKDTKPISGVVTFRLPAPFTLRHIACETPDSSSRWPSGWCSTMCASSSASTAPAFW